MCVHRFESGSLDHESGGSIGSDCGSIGHDSCVSIGLKLGP